MNCDDFFTSTTKKDGVTSKISASIASCPFLPSLDPWSFTSPSCFFTLKLSVSAICSSFDTIADAGFCVMNRESAFCSLSFSNRPDRSNPLEREMMSNAFKLTGFKELAGSFALPSLSLCATRRVEQPVLLLTLLEGAQPKVRHFEVAILVDEEVLWLEVSVVDTAAVTEVHSPYQLLEVLPRSILLESPPGYPAEELTTPDILHCKVYLALAGHDLVQLDDVGVANEAHDGDLSLDLVNHADTQYLFLVNDLDGDALVGCKVPCMVHLGEGALPEHAAELIPVHEDGRLLLHPAGFFRDSSVQKKQMGGFVYKRLLCATSGLLPPSLIHVMEG
uniref:Uncharacterized protein n=1 Tax=Oryza glumipatula TaxID=40148 RepID=A0A0D9Y504_9ORYZ